MPPHEAGAGDLGSVFEAIAIRHIQIAEARIAYGGRGDISRVQRTPAGQAVVERFTPF